MKPLRRSASRAFTLIEILVAMTVLTLLLLFMVQLTNSTMHVSSESQQAMDASKAARIVLDELNNDLANAVTLNGLTIFWAQDANNNTKLAFFTQCRGPNSTNDTYRGMAVAYQVEGNRLTRRSQPVLWTDIDLPKIITAASASGTVNVLAASVLRFQALALLDNGKIVPLSKSSSATTTLGQTVSDQFAALVLATPLVRSSQPRVRSLVAAVASIDLQTLRLGGASGISAALPTPAPDQTVYDAWDQTIFSGALASFPKPAVAALQISQRTFPLH